MTESIDLHYLLSSSEGQSHLQNGSNVFGVRVSSESQKFACVDFGITSISDWTVYTDVPKGYEELQESTKNMIMDQVITVSNLSSENISIKLTDFKVLPRKEKDCPYFLLLEMDDNEQFHLGKTLCPGSSVHFRLRCFIPGPSFVGSLNRWLIFYFSKVRRCSPTCIERFEFVSGLKVVGCVLSEGIKNKMLSSEAKPFIPISALTYFDSSTLSIMVRQGDTAALTIPLNYSSIVLEAREKQIPNDQFKSDYFYYSRRNAIPYLLTQILPEANLHGIVG